MRTTRRASRILMGAAAALAATLVVSAPAALAHDPETKEGAAAIAAFMADHEPAERTAAVTGAEVPCENGMAGDYPCKNVDLQSVLPLSDIGGGNGNDIWGWTDASTGKEYAIMGRTNGTAFVDVTTPTSPVYLGNLPSHNGTSSSWRDVKVYNDHAFVVADAISGHGMQVFDLTRLRNVTSPQTFTEDAHYNDFGPAHNIVINTDSGYAYAVGSDTCNAGPHIVDISTPKSPVAAGCVGGDGYTHDAQCVNYAGPDADYAGREICMNSNEDTLTIEDVTDKANPVQVSRTGYSGANYTHQGWFTEDQQYFVLDDELDESNNRRDQRTRTYIFDVSDLDNPAHIGTHIADVTAIDHNQYVKGDHVYQANYQAGLRILDVTGVGSGSLSEVAYFDIYPSGDAAEFNGAWSVYPYFDSGTVIISGIEQGLVVVKPDLSGSATTEFSSTDSVRIKAGSTVTSAIDVSGIDGSAPTALEVAPEITHRTPSALVIDLVAPDGAVYPLKADGEALQPSYTVDASASPASGTWQLRITDTRNGGKPGELTSWSLRF
ncbi:choice-of-anchor B family protein [Haloechinothrix halophila]|uniref:choice-of-anchor B family protein n=1 Tax=Haloechinothrix halophila TaxID=1069073 RepID=UPI00040E32C0|nr:choice-of-anchor B family protein [Haloechinothrix halophila]